MCCRKQHVFLLTIPCCSDIVFMERIKEKEQHPYSSFFLSYTSVPAIYGIMSHSCDSGTTDIYYDKRKLPVLQADSYKNFI